MEFVITIILTIGSQTTLDVNPTLVLPIATGDHGFAGTAWIPHVTTYDPTYGSWWSEEFIRHELVHARQWTALGPAFYPAYLLTGGRAFEDYKDAMWTPPEDMIENCPLLRVEGGRVVFMPCYRL